MFRYDELTAQEPHIPHSACHPNLHFFGVNKLHFSFLGALHNILVGRLVPDNLGPWIWICLTYWHAYNALRYF